MVRIQIDPTAIFVNVSYRPKYKIIPRLIFIFLIEIKTQLSAKTEGKGKGLLGKNLKKQNK